MAEILKKDEPEKAADRETKTRPVTRVTTERNFPLAFRHREAVASRENKPFELTGEVLR
jgi:hypothetical protein